MGSWGYFEYPTEPRWRRLGEESWEERDEKIAKELEWEAWPDYEELIAREDGAVMDGCDGDESPDPDVAYEQMREAREWGI